MDFGAAIFFTDYSMGPAALGRALEERGVESLWEASEPGHFAVSTIGANQDFTGERTSVFQFNTHPSFRTWPGLAPIVQSRQAETFDGLAACTFGKLFEAAVELGSQCQVSRRDLLQEGRLLLQIGSNLSTAIHIFDLAAFRIATSLAKSPQNKSKSRFAVNYGFRRPIPSLPLTAATGFTKRASQFIQKQFMMIP